jgi:site-specific recombinase XerD
MSSNDTSDEKWLTRLDSHLRSEGYSQTSRKIYRAESRRFLEYLAKRDIAVEAVEARDIWRYLHWERLRYCRRHGHPPSSRCEWRNSHTGGIHMLLRIVQGQWPPIPVPSNAPEVIHHQVYQEYVHWLFAVRGLAAETISRLGEEAKRFLVWLEECRDEPVSQLSVSTIDGYLTFRAVSLCRRSRKTLATSVRSFLRYLHMTGRITGDLAAFVVAPKVYALETIPSALRAEDVQAVVRTARRDHSAMGRRDYAILELLSTYGLRTGEIVNLRLEDVDWRRETLCIRHTKTGTQSYLPLLRSVGEAILAYLQTGRPKTSAREVFIRGCAPYQRLRSVYPLVQHRLREAGVHPVGKRGPHAFRHAKAVSLLRAGMSTKQIGDILGHRSTISTTAYLKLATEDLRAVALEIPGKVKS